MLVFFALGDANFSCHPTQNPNASQWNIGGVGFQTQHSCVGHLHFISFVSISFALGSQSKPSFSVEYGLKARPLLLTPYHYHQKSYRPAAHYNHKYLVYSLFAEQLVKYLSDSAIMVQIWGKQKPPKSKKTVNTKDAIAKQAMTKGKASLGNTNTKVSPAFVFGLSLLHCSSCPPP